MVANRLAVCRHPSMDSPTEWQNKREAYVKEKYSFYVHSLYIAQVRDKLGIKLRESANKVEQPKRKVSVYAECKEAAILDAFRHYGIYKA